MKVENENAAIYESNQHALGDDVINIFAIIILWQRFASRDGDKRPSATTISSAYPCLGVSRYVTRIKPRLIARIV